MNDVARAPAPTHRPNIEVGGAKGITAHWRYSKNSFRCRGGPTSYLTGQALRYISLCKNSFARSRFPPAASNASLALSFGTCNSSDMTTLSVFTGLLR